MISAQVFDAGTAAIVQRESVPGMDHVYWHEIDCEEEVFEPRAAEINEGVKAAAAPITVAPWPQPLRTGAPIDHSQRHRGISFQLMQLMQAMDDVAAGWSPAPGGAMQIVATPTPAVRAHTGTLRRASVAEVQATVAAPADFVRLPFGNEPGGSPCGGTQLEEQLILHWNGLQDCRYTLRLDDNDLFQPFDLSHPERYAFYSDAAERVEHAQVYSRFGDRVRLTLYLRPRRWRWSARVIAHFINATAFEMVPNDEVFYLAWYDRPPFAPVRHDIRTTAGTPAMWHEYEGAMLSYDPGIESKFTLSRASSTLRDQILDQQYFSPCMAYILIGVEPAALTVWREAARADEVVVGIGIHDPVSDQEQRVWAHSLTSLGTEYPRTLIDVFWSNFYVF